MRVDNIVLYCLDESFFFATFFALCFSLSFFLKKTVKKSNFFKRVNRLLIKGFSDFLKRRHPDSNWGIEDLQSTALPLGYTAGLNPSLLILFFQSRTFSYITTNLFLS